MVLENFEKQEKAAWDCAVVECGAANLGSIASESDCGMLCKGVAPRYMIQV